MQCVSLERGSFWGAWPDLLRRECFATGSTARRIFTIAETLSRSNAQRIAAAKAAYAARVRADAELASNPIVNVLGSPAQKEAAAARARFDQVLSEEEPAPAAAPAAGGDGPTSRKMTRANSVRRLSTIKITPN